MCPTCYRSNICMSEDGVIIIMYTCVCALLFHLNLMGAI